MDRSQPTFGRFAGASKQTPKFSPLSLRHDSNQDRMPFPSAKSTDAPESSLFRTLLDDPNKRKKVLELLLKEGMLSEKGTSNSISALKQFHTKLHKESSKSPKSSKLPLKINSPSSLMRWRGLRKLYAPQTLEPAPEEKTTPPKAMRSMVNFDRILRGVTAFVEVKTGEADRSPAVKEMLSRMGAVVRDTFTRDVTHVVFRDGCYDTYEKARCRNVPLISILWIKAMREKGHRLPESKYPAFGLQAYDAKISPICDELEKEFERTVREELDHDKACRRSLFVAEASSPVPSLCEETSTPKESPTCLDSESSNGEEIANVSASANAPVDDDDDIIPDSSSDCSVIIDGVFTSRPKDSMDVSSLSRSFAPSSPLNSLNNVAGMRKPQRYADLFSKQSASSGDTTDIEKDDSDSLVLRISSDKSSSNRISREKSDLKEKTDENIRAVTNNSNKISLETMELKEKSDKVELSTLATDSKDTKPKKSETAENFKKSVPLAIDQCGDSDEDIDVFENSNEIAMKPMCTKEAPKSSTNDRLSQEFSPCSVNLVRFDSSVGKKESADEIISNTPISNINTRQSKLSSNSSNLKAGGEKNFKKRTLQTALSIRKTRRKTRAIVSDSEDEGTHKPGKPKIRVDVHNSPQKDLSLTTAEGIPTKSSERLSTSNINKIRIIEDKAVQMVESPTAEERKSRKYRKVVSRAGNTNFNQSEPAELEECEPTVYEPTVYEPTLCDPTECEPAECEPAICKPTSKGIRKKLFCPNGSIDENQFNWPEEEPEPPKAVEDASILKLIIPRNYDPRDAKKTFKLVPGGRLQPKKQVSKPASLCTRSLRSKSLVRPPAKNSKSKEPLRISSSVEKPRKRGRKTNAEREALRQQEENKTLQVGTSENAIRGNLKSRTPAARKTQEKVSKGVPAEPVGKLATKAPENQPAMEEEMFPESSRLKSPFGRRSLLEDCIETLPEKIPGRVSKMTSEMASEKVPENAPEKISEKASEMVLEKVPEKALRKSLRQTPAIASAKPLVRRQSVRLASSGENAGTPSATRRSGRFTVRKKMEEQLSGSSSGNSKTLSRTTVGHNLAKEGQNQPSEKSGGKAQKRRRSVASLDKSPETEPKKSKLPTTLQNTLKARQPDQTCLAETRPEEVPKTAGERLLQPANRESNLLLNSDSENSELVRLADAKVRIEIPNTGLSNRSSTPCFNSVSQEVVTTSLPTTQAKSGRLPGITCTRFHRYEVVRLKSAVRSMGGFQMELKVTDATTHLVAKDLTRTINLLLAIARGCWVVKEEWFRHSVAARKWLDEEVYELIEFSTAVRKARVERQTFGKGFKMDLFSQHGRIFVSHMSKVKRGDLEELVALCGGNIASTARQADIIIGDRSKYENTVCLSENWVLDSVSCYKRRPFNKYLLV